MDRNVDEGWKDSVEKEKSEQVENIKEDTQTLQANFNTLISSMAMEALILLGELPNPITKKKEEHLDQAKYLIDTIVVLKEKTKGNLTAEEANSLDSILYELQTKFVAKKK